MDNSCKTAVAASMAGGYLLGRTKKAKFALGLIMLVAGRRLKLAPADLAAAGVRQLAENPQFAGLRDQVREDLFGAVKTVASAAMDRQVSSLTDALRERTAASSGAAEQGEGSDEDEDEDTGEEETDEPEESTESEDEDGGKGSKAPRRGSARSGGERKGARREEGSGGHGGTREGTKRAAAKRTTGKRTPAKRSSSSSGGAQHSRSSRSGR